jgi:tetrapyrrole methylase family protein/MazG family protein
MIKDRYSFEDFIEVIRYLRSEKGCPWDREQTHKTIKEELIEEAYEVLEAIDNDDDENLKEELGDLLLQVVFHSQIATEDNKFDINDIITGICKKLIYRHPHVFGEENIDNSKDVINRWDRLKAKEKGVNSHTEALRRVPQSLPALMRSSKVQIKAAKTGFDWDNIDDIFLKLEEEVRELKDAVKSGEKERIIDETGDLLFSGVNLARFLGVQPEFALSKTTDKFIDRFDYIEKKAKEKGKNPDMMSLAEMDKLWDEAKEREEK